MTSPHWCGVLMPDVGEDVAATDDRVAGLYTIQPE